MATGGILGSLYKKLLASLLAIAAIIICFPFLTSADVYVHGYTKKDGTYVAPYYRSSPDGNPYNNFSFPGNTNPYTGVTATGNPDTYLNDYYGTSNSGSGYTAYTPTYTPTKTNDELCWDQVGYMSSYDSLSNTCKCSYGYVLDSTGQCTSGNTVCMQKMGLMSEYNSLTNQCECMTGYQYDGSSCVYKNTYSSYSPSAYSASAYDAYSSCPTNSHQSSTDSTKCECNTGYTINAAKTSCILDVTTLNNQQCSNAFGANSIWNGTKTADGQLNCGCSAGYSWNSPTKSCISSTVQSQTASAATSADDANQKLIALLQAEVQILLAKIVALQAAKAQSN